MSAVTILSSAAQADSGAGAAVDVSAFSTLRLNWSVLADLGRSPQVDLAIDTAPSATGPWREVWALSMASDRDWQPAPRATLGGFDAYVRPRWAGHARNGNVALNDTTAKFTLGLAGDGKPD